MLPSGHILFCSWGDYDRRQLQQDCSFHRLPYLMGEHLNLKAAFTEQRGLRRKPGMAGALRIVGLDLAGEHHPGIDDARNIARLVGFVFEGVG